jgi:hypothetical protein
LLSPETNHEASEEFLDELCQDFRSILRARLAARPPSDSPLRFSALGKQDRQIWYDAHPDEAFPKEELRGPTLVKFLYGDLIEAMILYLTKEAGHEVKDYQKKVSVDGVNGSLDAIIDGTTVDVKSASPYGFQKFKQRTVTEEGNDPFGYVKQLAGYSTVETPGQDAAWIAVDKVSGEICVSPLKKEVIAEHDPQTRISELREIISKDEPPPRCYEDQEDGKSGNRKLGTGCSYCGDKFRCWPNLRGFAYSSGPRYLTVCHREPDVPEIT